MIISLVFDFDDTLAPDTTSGLLTHLGVDSERFWQEEVDPLLENDWDPVPAYLFALLNLSSSGKCLPITHDLLVHTGLNVKPYPGVTRMFNDLTKIVKNINSENS